MTPTLWGPPAFRLIANNNDLTDKIRGRLFSLQLTDEAGFDADMLEIVLVDDDPSRPIEVPPTGAELKLSLGYIEHLREMGLFVVDEIEVAGYPVALVIRGRAAPFETSKFGKKPMQDQKNRSWESGTKLKTMLETIAKEHEMEAAISASMAGITLPHFDQKEESDINFLMRIVRKFDGIVKPAGGYLTITKRGEGLSASGAELPRLTIRRDDVKSFRMTQQKRDSAGTVIANYKASKHAARMEVKVGTGDPVKRIGTNYNSRDLAVNAARTEYARRLRGQKVLNISIMGWPDVIAEMIVDVEQLHAAADGEWLTKSVTHRLSDGGYETDLVLEQPNSEEEPETTERVLVAPKVGSKESESDDDDGPAGVITLPPS